MSRISGHFKCVLCHYPTDETICEMCQDWIAVNSYGNRNISSPTTDPYSDDLDDYYPMNLNVTTYDTSSLPTRLRIMEPPGQVQEQARIHKPEPGSEPEQEPVRDNIIDTGDQSVNCIICMDNKKTHAFIHGETAHKVCCEGCAKMIQQRGDRCPLCRTPIDTVVKVF